MKFEQDQIRILGGVRHGETQGGPVAVEVGNTEWPKWEKVMSADPVDPVELEALARNAPLTRPRPGHADLVGMQKYGFDDARPVLERASARETAARVALGAVAKAFLSQAAPREAACMSIPPRVRTRPDREDFFGSCALDRPEETPELYPRPAVPGFFVLCGVRPALRSWGLSPRQFQCI